ncbi:MAG: bifunctional riboflavin kinase/FAD synthetase [Prevotellaceae bacterium]|jgi:riboflavin kinase/FMN adenylyltransferase|nr:bifunctional riboflavin kinase/FAD synthetase [Prevotellaceae bacterium]
MQIIDIKNIKENIENTAATIGFFDGVHEGHRFLLRQLTEIAATRAQKSLVVTFREHPNTVLNLQPVKRLLTSFDEKMQLLAALKIDYCAVFDFSETLAEHSAAQFISLLHSKLSVCTLLVGYDNRFGHNRVEGIDDYVRTGNRIGTEIVKIQPFIMGKGLEISSSKIRHLIQDSNIETANRLLGYNYFFSAKVVRGLEIGRTIGFPTANLELLCPEKILPIQGAYTVMVTLHNQTFRGMMNIGYNPTRAGDPLKTVEVNIFDFSQDIYGEILKITFLNKIRDEQKFDSLAQLKKQLHLDKDFAEKQ